MERAEALPAQRRRFATYGKPEVKAAYRWSDEKCRGCTNG